MRKWMFGALAAMVMAGTSVALSPDYQYAVEFRDHVKGLIDPQLEGGSLCGTVDLYQGKDGDAAFGARIDGLLAKWGWSVMGGGDVEYGTAYILDTNPRDPRAFGIAGVWGEEGGTVNVMFSRCLTRK